MQLIWHRANHLPSLRSDLTTFAVTSTSSLFQSVSPHLRHFQYSHRPWHSGITQRPDVGTRLSHLGLPNGWGSVTESIPTSKSSSALVTPMTFGTARIGFERSTISTSWMVASPIIWEFTHSLKQFLLRTARAP